VLTASKASYGRWVDLVVTSTPRAWISRPGTS